jgi:5'-3' exonuclease
MKILFIDGMNFLHRARSGFMAGENPVVFNAFRNLRALVGIHTPDKVFFVLEGHPQQRINILPSYKANRIIESVGDGEIPNPELEKKLVDRESFYRQVNLVLELLQNNFPIHVVKHPDYECDDTIHNLIKMQAFDDQIIVASNDSDFTQLLNEYDNVQVYNPMLKSYVEKPDFDYVVWKSLRGDGSDNIKGLPGVGDKTALKIINDPDKLMKLFESDENKNQFNENYSLIKFIDFVGDEYQKLICSTPARNWNVVKERFQKWDFQSILKEKSWDKFVQTFDVLI